MAAVTPPRTPEEHLQLFSARSRLSLPLSHLSIEVGHFFMKDLEKGEEPVLEQFRHVKPWLDAARSTVVCGVERPRVSTCFLIDDYFQHWPDAPYLMSRLLRLAAETGLVIDYVARLSACGRRQDGFPVADLVARRILEEPEPQDSTGRRPPTSQSGWLSNGRPPSAASGWEPGLEYAKRNHSIFTDVELWRDRAEATSDEEEVLSSRVYSYSFLAAVWQLVRLGLLRKDGAPALEVTDFDGHWRDDLHQFPDIIKVNPRASPLYAYRSLSILPHYFLGSEHAIRTIIDHVLLDPSVLESLGNRALGAEIPLPSSIADRISYCFYEGGQ